MYIVANCFWPPLSLLVGPRQPPSDAVVMLNLLILSKVLPVIDSDKFYSTFSFWPILVLGIVLPSAVTRALQMLKSM